MIPQLPLISISLVLSLLGCAGCDNQQNGAPPSGLETTTAPAPTDEPGQIGKPAPPSAEETSTPSPVPPAPLTEEPDEPPPLPVLERYTGLLREVVTKNGLVRYDLLRRPASAAALKSIVDELAAAKLPEDGTGQLALWCNAYNANVLAMALAESGKPGFESVVKVPGFFDGRTITVAGERLTLNDLENTRIRPRGDPRIHAALVCAAMSCPPLRAEAFTPEQLDDQLNDQCRRWINDPAKFRIVDDALGLSEILNWYGEDFTVSPYSNPTGFVLAFADSGGPLAKYIVTTQSPRTTWIEYDWGLNQAPRGEEDAP